MQTPHLLADAMCQAGFGTVILILIGAALVHAAYRLCGILTEINKTLSKPAVSAPAVGTPCATPAPVPSAAEAPAPTVDSGNAPTPEIIAVISAAVATVVGKSHRIVSIKPMSSSWERAGRQSVLTSHRIR